MQTEIRVQEHRGGQAGNAFGGLPDVATVEEEAEERLVGVEVFGGEREGLASTGEGGLAFAAMGGAGGENQAEIGVVGTQLDQIDQERLGGRPVVEEKERPCGGPEGVGRAQRGAGADEPEVRGDEFTLAQGAGGDGEGERAGE